MCYNIAGAHAVLYCLESSYSKQLAVGRADWTSEEGGYIVVGTRAVLCWVRMICLSNVVWDWGRGLRREGYCIATGLCAALYWVGELLV